MANDEKVRTSGEVLRAEASVPVLPVSMPTAEKPAQQSGGVHAAVYIAYVQKTRFQSEKPLKTIEN